MKTILYILFFPSLFLVTACSSSYVVSYSYEDPSVGEFNNFVRGQKAEIILRDTIVYNVKNVYLSADSLFWNEPGNNSKSGVVKSDVKKVIFSGHFVGGLDGAGLGMISGGIAGLGTAGLFAVTNSQGQTGWYYLILIPAGIVVGALAGFTTGLIIGHTYEFRF